MKFQIMLGVRKDNMDKYNLSFITKKIINSLIKVKYLK